MNIVQSIALGLLTILGAVGTAAIACMTTGVLVFDRPIETRFIEKSCPPPQFLHSKPSAKKRMTT